MPQNHSRASWDEVVFPLNLGQGLGLLIELMGLLKAIILCMISIMLELFAHFFIECFFSSGLGQVTHLHEAFIP